MRVLLAIIAIVVGLIILLGYFVPALQPMTSILLGWGVSLAGVATLVGILNLLGVHWRKMSAEQSPDRLSAVLILAFLLTAGAGFYFKPGNSQFLQVVTAIQVPVEASLMAILSVSLAYASLRLLQRRRDLMGFIFLLSAIVFLITGSGVLSTVGNAPLISTLLSALDWLPVAGARAILLGVALGSLTAGVRILIGADRPYGG